MIASGTMAVEETYPEVKLEVALKRYRGTRISQPSYRALAEIPRG